MEGVQEKFGALERENLRASHIRHQHSSTRIAVNADRGKWGKWYCFC